MMAVCLDVTRGCKAPLPLCSRMSIMCSLGVWGYQEAVRTLNTLQTNASYLEQVKRQRGDPQTQLEAMERYLARSGLQVSSGGL